MKLLKTLFAALMGPGGGPQQSQKEAAQILAIRAAELLWIPGNCPVDAIRDFLRSGSAKLIAEFVASASACSSGVCWKSLCNAFSNPSRGVPEIISVLSKISTVTPVISRDDLSIEIRDILTLMKVSELTRSRVDEYLLNPGRQETLLSAFRDAAYSCRTKDNWDRLVASLDYLSSGKMDLEGMIRDCFNGVKGSGYCWFEPLPDFQATNEESFRAALARCEADVHIALVSLEGSALICGAIEFETEIEGTTISVEYDFASAKYTVTGGDVNFPVHANSAVKEGSRRFCVSKVIRDGLAKDLGYFDNVLIPPEIKISPDCRSLVHFHVAYYPGKQVFQDAKAWEAREAWTMPMTANILRFFQYIHTRGVTTAPPYYHMTGASGDLKLVVPEFTFSVPNRAALIVSDLRILARQLRKGFNQESGSTFGLPLSHKLDLSDPIVLFLDSVYRFEGFDVFEYEKFIHGLDGEVQLDPLPIHLPHYSAVASWWAELDACMQEGATISQCSFARGDCATGKHYKLDDVPGEVIVGSMMSEGKGATAEVFRTSNVKILQKLVIARETAPHTSCLDVVDVACTERTSLSVLNGLHGHSPRQYSIESTDGKSECSGLSVFMEIAPGETARKWLARNPSDKDLLEFLAKLIDILKILHRYGFVHRDNHDENVFIDTSEGIMTVHLIDFGVARPVVDRVGSPVIWGDTFNPFISDLNTALATVGRKIHGDFPEMKEVMSLTVLDGVFQIPDYDRIIALIEQARDRL